MARKSFISSYLKNYSKCAKDALARYSGLSEVLSSQDSSQNHIVGLSVNALNNSSGLSAGNLQIDGRRISSNGIS